MCLPFRASWQKVIRPSSSFPPPPLFIPYGGFSPVRLEASLVLRRPSENLSGLRLTPELPFTRFWPFLIQASGTAAVPTGPWLSTVYHVRACNRYYGLIRQSDELRPAWLSQHTLAGLCPSRAVRLTFPSLSLSCALRPCRYPYPADCPVSFDGSSPGHGSLRLFCRDSAVSDLPLTGFCEGPLSRRQFSR